MTAQPPEAIAQPTEPADRSPAVEPGGPPADVWRRNTAVLVAFTAVTNLADGVMKIALPLVATSLTKSPALVSSVLLTLTLPWLLTALHVGVLVDRLDRRKLLWLAGVIQIAVLAVLFSLDLLEALSLPAIYGCGVVLGVAEVISMTSAAAIIPDAVAIAGRERVNTWVTGAETLCNEFAGPFAGGLLVGAGTAFALGATLTGYLLGAGVLLLLVGRFRVVAMVTPGMERQPIHTQISDGLRFMWEHRLLRMLALVVAVLGSCWGAWFAVMPLYATHVMGLSAADYGVLVGMLGVGGMVGTIIVSWSNRILGRRWTMIVDVFLTAALVTAPAVTTNMAAVACAAFLGGMGGTLWTVNSRTVGQILVPTEMMGRFGAAFRLFALGSTPVGAGLAGALAEWFSAPVALAVFAAGSLAVFVPFVRVFTATSEADIENRLKHPEPDIGGRLTAGQP
jgi:MFS family permease